MRIFRTGHVQGLLQGRQDPVCCCEHQENSEEIRIVGVTLIAYLHGDGLHVCLARSCHASQLFHANSIDEIEYLCAQKALRAQSRIFAQAGPGA